jgi:hypothetical protein
MVRNWCIAAIAIRKLMPLYSSRQAVILPRVVMCAMKSSARILIHLLPSIRNSIVPLATIQGMGRFRNVLNVTKSIKVRCPAQKL